MSCSSTATEPLLDLNELQMCFYAAEEQTLCFRKLMLHGVLTSQQEIMSVNTSENTDFALPGKCAGEEGMTSKSHEVPW